MSNVERILASQSKLGEGSLWSVAEQALYWVDIESNCFGRLKPATGEYSITDVGVSIGVMALRTGGGLVMAVKDGFATWDGQKLEYIAKPDPAQHHTRFNDGAVDCRGRFWAGTMGGPNREGVVYRLDPDRSLHMMITGVGVPNGIGWSPDNSIMYFTDSDLATIFAYDFDVTSGNITNRRVFVQVPEMSGAPDGLTVDNKGYVWSACWNGARIVRYTPDGSIDRVVGVPALRPTSCVFGGANMDELYITSAWTGLSDVEREQYPFSGDLFRYQAGVTGPAKFSWL